MDDRKNKIKELEKSRSDDQGNLNSLLENLGRTILSRPDIDKADAAVFPDIGEYHRLQNEITNSQASIKTVETQIARSRFLEEEIESREQQIRTHSKELEGHYAGLGKMVLEDPALRDFSVAYQGQADVLIPKVQSLEDRLSELTDKTKEGNIFTWIGKGTQGMVLKSFLSKAKENLDRLYCSAGEQFYKAQAEDNNMEKPSNVEINILGTEIDDNKNLIQSLSAELSKLKEEYQSINEGLAAFGGSVKQIQSLQKNIGNANDSLSVLYLHFGQLAFTENSNDSNSRSKKSGSINTLLNKDDFSVLDNAKQISLSIVESSEAIKKIQASIDIDDEWEKIEKLRRAIADKKTRIEEAERNISEFENRIKDGEKHIEELKQLL